MSAAIDQARAEAEVNDLVAKMKEAGPAQLKAIADELGASELFQKGTTKVTASPEAEEMVPIFHTLTGRSAIVPVYMLKNFLSHRFAREDWIPNPMVGQRVWSLTPTVEPSKGQYMCFLHPKHPRHDEFSALGLTGHECHQDAIPTLHDLDLHMQRKHKSAWQAIERDRTAREQRERDDLLRAQTEAMLAIAGRAVEPDKKPKKEA